MKKKYDLKRRDLDCSQKRPQQSVSANIGKSTVTGFYGQGLTMAIKTCIIDGIIDGLNQRFSDRGHLETFVVVVVVVITTRVWREICWCLLDRGKKCC